MILQAKQLTSFIFEGHRYLPDGIMGSDSYRTGSLKDFWGLPVKNDTSRPECGRNLERRWIRYPLIFQYKLHAGLGIGNDAQFIHFH